MNLHSITYYLFIISCIVIFSCDEVGDLVTSPVDCAGVTGGSATTDDCEQCTGGTTEKVANYLQDCAGVCNGTSVADCAGVCNGTSFIDCSYTCIAGSYLDWLGDGYCDDGTYTADFTCDEALCDSGDCGTWNGSYCQGTNGNSAIKWDCGICVAEGEIGSVTSIYKTDPSIPSIFYWDQYYDAIPGTYHYEYVGIGYPNNYLWSGYYTTYDNPGGINTSGQNHCFEFVFYFSQEPGFYEWSTSFDSECASFFSLSRRNDFIKDERYLNEYNRYLEDKQKDYIALEQSGNINNIVIEPTFTMISNPTQDIRINNIDSDPNVIIQIGSHYLHKSIRKEIPKP